MQERIAYLQMIQTVIERMARCSFLLRGWSVTLVSAIFAIAAKDSEASYVILAFLPIFAFWLLDGFYLFQERLFRELYKDVAANPNNKSFSMDTRSFKGKTWKLTWAGACFSTTSLVFYIAVIGVTIIVMFVLVPNMPRGA